MAKPVTQASRHTPDNCDRRRFYQIGLLGIGARGRAHMTGYPTGACSRGERPAGWTMPRMHGWPWLIPVRMLFSKAGKYGIS